MSPFDSESVQCIVPNFSVLFIRLGLGYITSLNVQAPELSTRMDGKVKTKDRSSIVTQMDCFLFIRLLVTF